MVLFQHALTHLDRTIDQISSQFLKAGSRDGHVDVERIARIAKGHEWNRYLDFHAITQIDFALLGDLTQSLQGGRLGTQVHTVLTVEAGENFIEQDLIKINAAEEKIADPGRAVTVCLPALIMSGSTSSLVG